MRNENYKKLIEFILEETPFNVMLVPHVVRKGHDDRETAKKLYDLFNLNFLNNY